MDEALSQKKIDNIVDNVITEKQTEQLQVNGINSNNNSKQTQPEVRVYDFSSPKRYTREQLKILNNIYDNIERFISLQLSGMLRVSCSGEILDVVEDEFRNFVDRQDESVLIGMVSVSSVEQHIDSKQLLVEIERPLSFCIIDRLLGGDGSCFNIKRDYTDIEMSILQRLFMQILPQFTSGWSNYTHLEHELETLETNARMIQSIANEDTIVVLRIKLVVKELEGIITVCIPAETMDVMVKVFESKFTKNLKKGDVRQEELRKANMMNILKESSLTVTGVLGKTEIQLQELLDLQNGDIFLLDNRSDEPSITIEVEGKPWFTGEMGIYKKDYAIHIEKVLAQK